MHTKNAMIVKVAVKMVGWITFRLVRYFQKRRDLSLKDFNNTYSRLKADPSWAFSDPLAECFVWGSRGSISSQKKSLRIFGCFVCSWSTIKYTTCSKMYINIYQMYFRRDIKLKFFFPVWYYVVLWSKHVFSLETDCIK